MYTCHWMLLIYRKYKHFIMIQKLTMYELVQQTWINKSSYKPNIYHYKLTVMWQSTWDVKNIKTCNSLHAKKSILIEWWPWWISKPWRGQYTIYNVQPLPFSFQCKKCQIYFFLTSTVSTPNREYTIMHIKCNISNSDIHI